MHTLHCCQLPYKHVGRGSSSLICENVIPEVYMNFNFLGSKIMLEFKGSGKNHGGLWVCNGVLWQWWFVGMCDAWEEIESFMFEECLSPSYYNI